MQDISARSQTLIKEYVEGRLNEYGTFVIMEKVTRNNERCLQGYHSRTPVSINRFFQ